MTRSTATYRIQFRGDMTLDRAAGLAPHLARLGVSEVYASPLFTAPGVPEIYQGTELWDLSFVDPDNRRPFGYKSRDEALQTIGAASPERFSPTGRAASSSCA